MYYTGKSLDGFEYAMNSLLLRENLMPTAHLDCLSLRCFGFRCEGQPGNWFRPVIPWSEYLERALRLSGCRGCIKEARSFPVAEGFFQKWTLLGEISRAPFDHSVRSKFYPDLPGFFLCRQRQDGILVLEDPIGAAYIETETSALAAVLEQSQGFILQLCDDCAGAVMDARSVLHEALVWHTRFDETENFDFAANYRENIREKITLQYCLMDHQVQLSKVLRLAGAVVGMDIAPLEPLLAEYPQIALNSRVESLGILEKKFWDTLKEMEAGN